MKFTPDNYIEWYTPTETGYFASATGIDDGVYRTASFSYDPVTGSAKGTFGEEAVFDVTTSTGLFAQTVFFMNYAPGQGTGSFLIDNVKAVSTGTIPGDANESGVVDVVDLGILATHYGETGIAAADRWGFGDFSNDGNVDVVDLGILATNYGLSGGAEVPEPISLSIFGLGIMAIIRRKW